MVFTVVPVSHLLLVSSFPLTTHLTVPIATLSSQFKRYKEVLKSKENNEEQVLPFLLRLYIYIYRPGFYCVELHRAKASPFCMFSILSWCNTYFVLHLHVETKVSWSVVYRCIVSCACSISPAFCTRQSRIKSLTARRACIRLVGD